MAFSYYKPLVIDKTKCGSADTSGFVFLVSDTDVSLKTTGNGGKVQNANGYDICFYSDSSLTTRLKHETITYNASTGAGIWWVKLSNLSVSANTTIYRAYGDSSISTDQSDKTNVWPSTAKAVLHLNESRSTSAGAYKDSTSNANNGTLTDADSSVSSTTGKIYNAVSFSGNAADYINITSNAGLIPTGSFSASCWMQFASNPSSSDFWGIFGKTDATSYCLGMILYNNGTTRVVDGWFQDSGWNFKEAIHTTALSTSTWYYVSVVFDTTANTITTYANTTPITTTGITVDPADSGSPWRLGYSASGSTARGFNGLLEEMRIYIGAAITESQITAEYNNQNSPSTFYSVGTEVDQSAPTRRNIIIF